MAPADTQVLRLQLRLLERQLSRLPLAVALVDLFIVLLFVRHGHPAWLWALWYGLSMALQVGRSSHGRRLIRPAAEPGPREARVLVAWFGVIGLTRVPPVLAVGLAGSGEQQYLVTMVMVGLAAGGVGSAAGMVAGFLAWAVPVCGSLVVLWLTHGTFEGAWIAVLVVLMFAVLAAYVRDFGQALSQQIALNDQLRTERDRAETAVAARNRFFAAASHDLRQPLGVMRWYGDAVRMHAASLGHAALQDIGDGIGRAVERAEPLVRRYLEVTRLEAGAAPATPEWLDATAVLQDAHTAHRRDAEERDLRLVLELPQAPQEPLAVCTDPAHLRAILDNLIGNALKFTAAGTVTLALQHVEGDAGPRARFEVRDTGVGIDASEHDRIFDDFYQVGNPQRSASQGVGLGLSIVKRLCQLLATDVQVNSRIGQGSTFAFELPARVLADPPVAAPRPTYGTGQRRFVLLVDDEDEVRRSLQLGLESAGCSVTGGSSAQAAIEAQRQSGVSPDVVLVDFRLGGGTDGRDALAALRAAGMGCPAIFVTGDTAPERLRDLAATGLPVLHKPVALDVLLQTIERCIGEGRDEKRYAMAV